MILFDTLGYQKIDTKFNKNSIFGCYIILKTSSGTVNEQQKRVELFKELIDSSNSSRLKPCYYPLDEVTPQDFAAIFKCT